MTVEYYEPISDYKGKPKTDPAFFVDGNGHDLVAIVTSGKREIRIFCDGEMRLHIWSDAKGRENNEPHLTIRNAAHLIEAGITNDDELRAIDEQQRSDWGNNAWFDLYAYDEGMNGEHLDCVHFDINDAVEQAQGLIDDDAYWQSLK